MELTQSVKVHSIRVGSIVVDIFRKENEATGHVYFDYLNHRRVKTLDGWKTSPICQQRDMRDHLRALIDAMEWVSDQYRELRLGNSDI